MSNKDILIIGAGSIGNHMAYASRKLNLDVGVTDISRVALKRMKNKTYIQRYGKWDPNIDIIPFKKVFEIKKKYKLIIIGTPPNTHYKIFKKISQNMKYENILIEKPLVNFNSKNFEKFSDINGRTFCGYNHSLSNAFKHYLNILKKKKINKKKINLIHVEWKEGWTGILKAHPWLKNEFQSYLGNLKEGGGALQEHSHGLHLLLIILNFYKINLDKKKTNFFSIKNKKKTKQYDCYTNLTSFSNNTLINYETDLLSKNSKKQIKIEIDDFQYRLIFNYLPNVDAVIIEKNRKILEKKLFKKNRSTEFQNEISHILKIDNKNYLSSPIHYKKGLNVIKIIRKVLIN
jgi:hypothetical protein